MTNEQKTWKPLHRRGWKQAIEMPNNSAYLGLGERLDGKGRAYLFSATPFSAESIEREITAHYRFRNKVVMNKRKSLGLEYAGYEYEIYLDKRDNYENQ